MESEVGPSTIRRELAAGQRRRVTLLFSDLCDYTTISERIDPEESDALRRQIEQLATETIRKHGGAISQ
jgi:class 3 adenylate cyclase